MAQYRQFGTNLQTCPPWETLTYDYLLFETILKLRYHHIKKNFIHFKIKEIILETIPSILFHNFLPLSLILNVLKSSQNKTFFEYLLLIFTNVCIFVALR